MPITEDGQIGSKLVGLCTKRDVDLVDERSDPLSEHMTPVDGLVLGRKGCSLQEAQDIIKVSKKGERKKLFFSFFFFRSLIYLVILNRKN